MKRSSVIVEKEQQLHKTLEEVKDLMVQRVKEKTGPYKVMKGIEKNG